MRKKQRKSYLLLRGWERTPVKEEEEEEEEEEGGEVMRVTSRARSRRYQSLACSLEARSAFLAVKRASPPCVGWVWWGKEKRGGDKL